MSVELISNVEIEIPLVPCLLLLVARDQPPDSQVQAPERSLPLSAFSEEQLEKLGAAWTAALIAKSKGDPT